MPELCAEVRRLKERDDARTGEISEALCAEVSRLQAKFRGATAACVMFKDELGQQDEIAKALVTENQRLKDFISNHAVVTDD